MTALRNLTPRYDMASMMSGVPLASLVEDDFFSFWMDFLVDSVPLSSFTTVEPRYYCNQNKMTHFLTCYIRSNISVTNINIRIKNQRYSKLVTCVGSGHTDPTHSSQTSWKWTLLVKLIVAHKQLRNSLPFTKSYVSFSCAQQPNIRFYLDLDKSSAHLLILFLKKPL